MPAFRHPAMSLLYNDNGSWLEAVIEIFALLIIDLTFSRGFIS